MTINTINQIIENYNSQFNAEELPVNRLAPSDVVIAIIATIIDKHSHSCDVDDPDIIVEALEDIENDMSDDFTLDFDGNEYRIISDSDIWNIYVDEIKRTVEECYNLKLNDIPHFVEFSIDWGQTAKNCYVDGYGHTFSGYDGSEIKTSGYYIFRNN